MRSRRSDARHSSSSAVAAIGIDVGGTKIAAGLVTPKGSVLAQFQIPTRPRRGGPAVLADALGLARQLKRDAASRRINLSAVGVGVCELVDLGGRVTSAQTIRWSGLRVAATFRSIAPAWIDSDSRAAAFAEARFGAGRPYPSFLFLTVGTGIGSCFILNGRPHSGARGSTGTLATAPLTVFDPATEKPLRSVLEEFASGPALARRYNKMARHRVRSAEAVVDLASRRDPTARTIVRTAGEALGSTVALLINVLDPHAVIVGGGLGSTPGLYWETLVRSVRRHIWSDTHRDLPILRAALGSNAGLVGAAALALDHQQATSPDTPDAG